MPARTDVFKWKGKDLDRLTLGERLEVRTDIRSALGQVNAMIGYFEVAEKPLIVSIWPR